MAAVQIESIPSYSLYWGKAKKNSSQMDGADYHLLAYHSLDVAAVGALLLAPHKTLTKELAAFLDLTAEQLQAMFSFVLSLHDLGKFASAFQKLYTHQDANLLRCNHCKDYDGREYRHDRMALFFWQTIKKDILPQLMGINNLDKRRQGCLNDSLMVLMNCVFGHHGQPIDMGSPQSIKPYTESHNSESAQLFTQHMFALFQPEFPLSKFISKEWQQRLELVSWQLAGVAVLADWIGSDNHYFHYQCEPISLDEYWQKTQGIAVAALAATDFDAEIRVRPYLSIKEYYGYDPTPLQHWAETVAVDDSPQLFILEDVTGSGKTEAALALTHRLMQAGAANGFYFGLPTMATSNAMFSRVAAHYHHMLAGDDNNYPSIVLAHGAREMNDLFREAVLSSGATDVDYDATDATVTAQCNQWLADSRKKALLAPVGVGTIDQALLAVLPRRHQSLRLLGLNHKILIFDEVHAADEFMFELLESLLALHLHQGGSAILLTATLSQKQRARLVATWHKAGGMSPQALEKVDFPLATKASLNLYQPLLEQPLSNVDGVQREVCISFLHSFESSVDKVLSAAAQGCCVVWVRNSVNDALAAYHLIRDQLQQPDDCLLFHSRFVLQDRKAIENKVLAIFGKSSGAVERRGKILIATQVFQESLDADADIMLSDICPIDDLIQRAGRLHRHARDAEGNFQCSGKDTRSAPVLFLHAPTWDTSPATDWLSADFRDTQYVYRSPGRLWLGMRELMDLQAIRMPVDARRLIEAVYGDEAYEQIPAALKNQENELIGEERSKAAKAKSQLLQWHKFGYCDRSAMWHDDNSDISTRYSDIETVQVLLLKQTESGQLIPWVNCESTDHHPNEDSKYAVQLSTIKLSKNKYADKLQAIPSELAREEMALKQRYKQASYLQCWLPDSDPNFSYQCTTGFYCVEKE